jgi:hypothetical protein
LRKEVIPMAKKKITRRQFIKGVAAGGAAIAGAAAIPGVSRKAYAQKPKLSIAMWNHWVPGATDVQRSVIEEWAKKNKVDMTADFIGPSATEMLTVASAEYRAGTGHDIMVLTTWDGNFFKDKLEPMDDVADYIQGKYGKFDEISTFLSKVDGKWITVPAPTGSHSYPMVTRMDRWREITGMDVVDVFPPDVTKRKASKVKKFTYKAFLATRMTGSVRCSSPSGLCLWMQRETSPSNPMRPLRRLIICSSLSSICRRRSMAGTMVPITVGSSPERVRPFRIHPAPGPWP